ncbi:M23 family metallopeptidase [Roseovarius gahaiensis]|uniref:M23 family metallopeptidase n=1 Tax=Roseovarius gahaiensis TaxID=2716691 RepID=A0A967BE58_9RHOB|nr:M23 family metallopeptidase [Roseovarius gahaiensis]NHQ74609.1 M23 family metallopeptidase [Roseovarius gahaiensis]
MPRPWLALCGFLVSVAAPVAAEMPVLGLPIDCTLGTSCYVEDYVDTDPGSGQRDYACGLKSRDNHRGTDIVLLSFDAMEAGVNVLAAAPGRVAATRDGVQDVAITPKNRADIEGRECGNAVRIDHGSGWQTLYCHLKQNSIRVKQGDRVQAGDVLGLVGLSGLTNVPHVHLGVLKDGEIVDPFNPENRDTCGTATGNGMWKEAPGYDRAGLFTAGFATAVPDFDAVKSGAARVRDTAPDQPLVLYGHAFYAKPGDALSLSATGPEGEIFRHDVILENPQAQLFRAFGRRAPQDGWPEGAYRGYVHLTREGRVIAVRHADITITSR